MTLGQFSALSVAAVRRERSVLSSKAKAVRAASQYQKQDWIRFINALDKEI